MNRYCKLFIFVGTLLLCSQAFGAAAADGGGEKEVSFALFYPPELQPLKGWVDFQNMQKRDQFDEFSGREAERRPVESSGPGEAAVDSGVPEGKAADGAAAAAAGEPVVVVQPDVDIFSCDYIDEVCAQENNKRRLWQLAFEYGLRPNIESSQDELCDLLKSRCGKGKFKQRKTLTFDDDTFSSKDYSPDIGCELIYEPSSKSLMQDREGLKVLSVSLFRPANPNARALEYFNGLKDFVRIAYENFPGWIVRVYYDKSLLVGPESKKYWKDLLDSLRRFPNVQLVRYCCPAYLEDEHRHSGLFGSIMRFLAMFDPKVEYAVFRDIDSNLSLGDKANIDAWIESGKDFFFYNPDNYYPTYLGRFNLVVMLKKSSEGVEFKDHPLIALAGGWASKGTDDFSLWRRMLNSLEDYDEFLKKSLRNPIYPHDPRTQFHFGFDEILLNQYIVPYAAEKGFFAVSLPRIYDFIRDHYLPRVYGQRMIKELGLDSIWDPIDTFIKRDVETQKKVVQWHIDKVKEEPGLLRCKYLGRLELKDLDKVPFSFEEFVYPRQKIGKIF